MDEISWFIDYYSLDFELLFSSIYLENIGAYENDTAPDVDNATNRAERKGGPSKRAILAETRMETKNLPRF